MTNEAKTMRKPNTERVSSRDLVPGDKLWMRPSDDYRDSLSSEIPKRTLTGLRTIERIEVISHKQPHGRKASRYYRVWWVEGGRSDLSAPSRHSRVVA